MATEVIDLDLPQEGNSAASLRDLPELIRKGRAIVEGKTPLEFKGLILWVIPFNFTVRAKP